jgi:hypothetical protein
MTDASIHAFVSSIDAWNDREVQRTLSRWATSSIRTRPRAYLGAAVTATMQMLQLGPLASTDTAYTIRRLSMDGREQRQTAANMQLSMPADGLADFASPPARGPMARLCTWIGSNRIRGVPSIPLMVCGIAAIFGLIRRRQYGPAIASLGTFAFLLAHIALLEPWDRMAVPVIACWVLLTPDAAAIFDRRGQGQPVA